MRIALAIPPVYGVNVPPLGLAYIAGQLLKDGHKVQIFCLNSRLYKTCPSKRFLWNMNNSGQWQKTQRIYKHFDVHTLADQWAQKILAVDPEIIGLSVNIYSRIFADAVAEAMKKRKPGIIVIFGGPLCNNLQEDVLNPNVDLYVRGEGEQIISNVIRHLTEHGSLSFLTIKSTVINQNGTFKDLGWNPQPLDVNSLPFPALHLFPWENYTSKKEIPILFSRGCNYSCTYCNDTTTWGRYRMRDPNNILQEIILHRRLFGRKRFKCSDLMVNGDSKKLLDLARRIIEHKLDIEWGGMARPRAELSHDVYETLRKAGCRYFSYGVESGSEKVLNHMGKPPAKKVARALKKTHAAGIRVYTLWMIGYPTESWSDLWHTIYFLIRNRNSIDEFVGTSCCYIFENSWLGKHQEKLHIQRCPPQQWYISGKNTPGIRQWRKNLLVAAGCLLGLPSIQDTSFFLRILFKPLKYLPFRIGTLIADMKWHLRA